MIIMNTRHKEIIRNHARLKSFWPEIHFKQQHHLWLLLLQPPQAFKSPGKSQPVSMLLEAGRSFSPAVMSQLDVDEVDSACHGEGDRVSFFF